MDKEQVEKFKSKLIVQKKELEEKVAELKKIPEFGDDVDSLEEEANESQEFGNQLAELQGYQERLDKVNRALEKINSGSGFGACENCEKEIENEVLELVPESRRCKTCKKL